MPLELPGLVQNEFWDGQNTMAPELPAQPLSDGQPDNVVNVPRSDGITLGGILSGVEATANNLFNTFGKVYNLTSKVEDARFNRTVQQATLDLNRARVMGTLDAERAAVDASVAIEKARAARATNDALAQVNSGRAGYLVQSGMSPLLVLAAVAGLFIFLKRGKA